MHISKLQEHLPWDNSQYSDEFKQSKDDIKDFKHALFHIIKASGKLISQVEEYDHVGDKRKLNTLDAGKDLSDIIISCCRAANTFPIKINLEQTVFDRLHQKNKNLPSNLDELLEFNNNPFLNGMVKILFNQIKSFEYSPKDLINFIRLLLKNQKSKNVFINELINLLALLKDEESK